MLFSLKTKEFEVLETNMNAEHKNTGIAGIPGGGSCIEGNQGAVSAIIVFSKSIKN
jgi:hypothetical protein